MKRHAFPATCPRCDADVLATQWDYTDEMPCHEGTRRADPTSISPEVETACILLARPTYSLYTRAGRPHITRRDPRWHHWHDHGTPRAILPAHQCGRPLPGDPLEFTDPDTLIPADPNQLDLTRLEPHPF